MSHSFKCSRSFRYDSELKLPSHLVTNESAMLQQSSVVSLRGAAPRDSGAISGSS